MANALPATDISQASTYLEGAVDITLRNRFLTGWLDKAGRIKRDATGKDYNWLIEFKETQAQPYTPYQQLNFNNDNFNVAASVTPEWFYTSSGMDVTEQLTNSGPSTILNNYKRRVTKLARAMEIYVAKALYSDNAAAAGANRLIGLATLCKKSLSISTTNADRIAPPLSGVTYAGLDLSLGSQGGTWSNNTATAYQMNTHLGNDWPDGQGDPSNAYDGTSPRLYNENSTCWATPGTPGSSNWRTNCIAMLSRANTDLRMNTLESMMPNIHLSGAERYQSIKDKLREAFRDIMTTHKASEDLGYYQTLDFEGAAISLDHECPSDRTYSLCAAAMELFFYGQPNDAKAQEAGMSSDAQRVTGGIYSTYGPERPAGSLQTVWLMFAGGNTRYQPKWMVCHKDWT